MATYQIAINERTKEGKELLAQLKQNKTVQFKQKLNDPTKMTKAEFMAKINRASKQIARGEYIELRTKKDIRNYIINL